MGVILNLIVVFALFILICCCYFVLLENIRRFNCRNGRHMNTNKGICITCGNDSSS